MDKQLDMFKTQMQETSLEAYDKILDTLGQKQMLVFKIIKIIQPCTDLDIATKLNLPINQITPRRNELVKMGLVAEKDVIKNQYNRNAIRWEVNKDL